MEEYLHILKALAEGRMDLKDWQAWWDENAGVIEPRVSRVWFLRLKHQPFRQAQHLLEELGVAFQPDRSKCERCGETLFIAVPGETTREEIIEFARRSNFPWAEQIEKDGWIHPGEYCPNCGTLGFVHYGNGDLFERMEAEFEKTHTCQVLIMADGTLPRPLSRYNFYIDGNIAGTRRKDTQPENGEMVWLLPGDHRIVVRESDVKKAGRMESDTLWFTISEGALFRFEVGLVDGQLKLSQREPGPQEI